MFSTVTCWRLWLPVDDLSAAVSLTNILQMETLNLPDTHSPKHMSLGFNWPKAVDGFSAASSFQRMQSFGASFGSHLGISAAGPRLHEMFLRVRCFQCDFLKSAFFLDYLTVFLLIPVCCTRTITISAKPHEPFFSVVVAEDVSNTQLRPSQVPL